jgi:hypothetical protein
MQYTVRFPLGVAMYGVQTDDCFIARDLDDEWGSRLINWGVRPISIRHLTVVLVLMIVGIPTSASAVQGSSPITPARIVIIPETRWTAYTYRDRLSFGGDAAGFGITIQGPAWHGIRPWASATLVDLDVGCIDFEPCHDEGRVYRAGAVFDFGAVKPGSALQPYIGIGMGHATRGPRSYSWIFAPIGGLALRLSRHIGIRAGISWGERPLKDRVWTVDGGLRIELLH